MGSKNEKAAEKAGQTLQKEFETLKGLVTEAESDVAKDAGGNKAAGARVRKFAMAVKKQAAVIKTASLAVRDANAGA